MALLKVINSGMQSINTLSGHEILARAIFLEEDERVFADFGEGPFGPMVVAIGGAVRGNSTDTSGSASYAACYKAKPEEPSSVGIPIEQR